MLLELLDLNVCVEQRVVVKNVTMKIGRGEIHAIMGPNGSGKTTLLSAIMGLRHARICGGRILFEGTDISNMPSYERAKLGIALAHQHPPEVRGVKFSEIASAIVKKHGCSDCLIFAKSLISEDLLHRDLFVGFSGGERKRGELYLVLAQNPKLALLDEPDSGVDVESVELIARAIEILWKRGSSVIIVSHFGNIIEKLTRIDKVYLMIDGEIAYSGLPDEIIPVVTKHGYRKGVEILKKGGVR